MRKLHSLAILVGVLAVLAGFAPRATAAAFTPGNIVVLRVGTGGAALGATGTAAFLDEYTTAGALVQSIPLPTTVVGSDRRLVVSGTATSEGLITRSVDGARLAVAGYDAATGTTVTSSQWQTVNRVIGLVDDGGNVDTTTALGPTGDTTTGNARGAAVDGTDAWITGSTSGVRHADAPPAYTGLFTTPTNIRNALIVEDFGSTPGFRQLLVSSQTGAFRLSTVGSGTPVGSGQTLTNLPGFPTSTGSPYQFFFADLSGAVAGVDTVYVADDGGGGVQKYSFDGALWSSAPVGSITAASARGLTGVVNGTTVTLFVAYGGTSNNNLGTVTDTAGYNAAPSTTTMTVLTTAGTNRVFRGVAFVPAPKLAVSSIVRAGASPTSAASVDFTVTFNRAVSGVDTSDFVLATSGITGASVTGVAGTAPTSTWTVSVGTGSGVGTIRLDLVDDDTVRDTTGLRLGGSGTSGGGDGGFNTGEFYVLRDLCWGVAPTFGGLTSATPSDCKVDLAWTAATSSCGGTVTYNVYRDTTAAFTPTAANRLAQGVAGTTYTDTSSLTSTGTYYYLVRAVTDANGAEDANTAYQSATMACVFGTGPAPVTYLSVRSGEQQNVVEWVNPGGPYTRNHIEWNAGASSCTAPTMYYTGAGSTDVVASAGGRGSYSHGSLTNGWKYCYSIWVEGPTGGSSVNKTTWGRPVDTTGQVKWSHVTEGAALAASGVLPTRSYHAVSNDRIMHAMDPGTTGGTWPAGWMPYKMNAAAQARPMVAAPATTTVRGSSRVAIVGSQDGRVYAFSPVTGAVLWSTGQLAPAGAPIQAGVRTMFTDYGGAYNLVFAGTRDASNPNQLHAIDLQTGAVKWSFTNAGGQGGDGTSMGMVSTGGALQYSGNRLYFTTYQGTGATPSTGNVWCLTFTDSTVQLCPAVGTLTWPLSLGAGANIEAAPTIRGNVLYAGDTGGVVYAVDLTGGAGPVLWSTSALEAGGVKGFVWPEAASTHLYLTTTTGVWSLDDQGTAVAAYWTGGAASAAGKVTASSPAPALFLNGKVYVGVSGGLLVIDGSTPGNVTTSTVTLGDGTATAGAVTADSNTGLLLVGATDGVVYAVQP